MTAEPENSPAAGRGDPRPGARRRVTSYDVARAAGVSQSAVSRTFRVGGSVSGKARARIEAAARELGYAPSNIARSLITSRSRMVGVLVTDVTTANYPEILFHLGHEIQATGSRMLVFAVPRDDEAGAALADLLAYHVDGIVSCVSMPEPMLRICERHRVPVVLYNRIPRGSLASAVGCDHATAMADMAGHLVAGGLGRAAFVAGPAGAPVSDDRLGGARAAMAGRGLALDRVVEGDYSYAGGRALARTLCARSDRPDIVICANDMMALGVMDACRFDLGLRVPEDVAVAGFDDIPQAAWPTYGLTTLRQPVRRMTRAAVGMLMAHVAGEEIGSERRLMQAEIKIRASTRRPLDDAPSSTPRPPEEMVGPSPRRVRAPCPGPEPDPRRTA